MQEVERIRQQTIEDYQLGQTGDEPEFDAVTGLAADLFTVPIAAITVLGRDRQMFHSVCGLDVDGTARKDAFCNFTVEQSGVFVVEDAAQDPRFAANPLVIGEPHVRFYAGASITIGDGVSVGALCLIDRSPRRFSTEERSRLAALARIVGGMMELRIGSRISQQRGNELQHQAELLRATVDHAREGIAVFDADGILILSNHHLFEVLGLDPAQFEPGGHRASEILNMAASEGQLVATGLDRLVTPLRFGSDTQVAPHLLRGTSGQIYEARHEGMSDGRSILTVEDVTERRRMVKMKDEFVSIVSHELRTPLTSIRGALTVLERIAGTQLDNKAIKMLSMASRNAERLSQLVDDILDIEKLGSGTQVVALEAIDLVHVLRDAWERSQPFAETHGIEVTLELADTLPVRGDAGRLGQAVTNLLSNACKFSARHKRVDIRGSSEGKLIRIQVQDQGRGIPREFYPQIFGRFAQADPEHRSGVSGSGLGLAITKAIVEQHGGEIGFTSTLGEGTSFWITLPRRYSKDGRDEE